MKAYPLHFPEKAPKGTKQGAKLPEVLIQGREIGVFLAFSRLPSSVEWIEQDLRNRVLYPAELQRQMIYYVILASQRVQVKKKQNKTDLFGAAFSLFGRA